MKMLTKIMNNADEAAKLFYSFRMIACKTISETQI